MIRGTSGGICLSKVKVALAVSPIINIKAWGMVPAAGIPVNLAPVTDEPDLQPPVTAA
jgi:hypothetical protein